MELANHGLILLQQLNAQREFGFLCDCTVAIGDVFFKAHKAVLAAFSNYFRMLFIHQDRYRRNVLIVVAPLGSAKKKRAMCKSLFSVYKCNVMYTVYKPCSHKLS